MAAATAADAASVIDSESEPRRTAAPSPEIPIEPASSARAASFSVAEPEWRVSRRARSPGLSRARLAGVGDTTVAPAMVSAGE